jgi:small-conductance mechanosensitive channel
MESLLEITLWKNTLFDFAQFGVLLLLGVLLIRLVRQLAFFRLQAWRERSHTLFDLKIQKRLEQSLGPLLYFAVFDLSIRKLELHPFLDRTLHILGIALVSIFGVRLLNTAIEFVIRYHWLKPPEDESREKTIQAILPSVKVLIGGMGLAFFLDNLGFSVTAVITGFGVTGVAVALGAQAILGDLFSYFAIVFDRPFEVGDTISIDTIQGSVERIGIKTTRIRSQTGEEVIMANKDLTNSRLRNFRRMERRQIQYRFGVPLDTPREQVAAIPSLVREILQGMEKVTVDRVHFVAYGDFSFVFEVIFRVEDSRYEVALDIQQALNLRLLEEFEKRGIRLAYPTHAVHLYQKLV